MKIRYRPRGEFLRSAELTIADVLPQLDVLLPLPPIDWGTFNGGRTLYQAKPGECVALVHVPRKPRKLSDSEREVMLASARAGMIQRVRERAIDDMRTGDVGGFLGRVFLLAILTADDEPPPGEVN